MKKILNSLFPGNVWSVTTRTLAVCIAFKFILFDLIWALQTTFYSFSTPQLYINTALISLILLLPYISLRRKLIEAIVMFAIDAWLIANLMYSRTYYAAIPLESYGLVSNLSDFTASVTDSLRWVDILFPMSTIAVLIFKRKIKDKILSLKEIGIYIANVAILAAISFALNLFGGGFVAAYDSLQNANRHSCGVPMYTLAGHLYRQSQMHKATFTAKDKQLIESWLNNQPQSTFNDSIATRTNLVVILCESLESWVIEQKVEGKEITPRLNKIIAESNTLYAPHVFTQVGGGRSIDAQLLLNAGLLPIENGTYSTQYPLNTYHTLTKAMKEKYGSRGYILTVDKAITWNQGMVARAFGIDSVIDKPCWRNDEKVGTKKKLGDNSFFKQCIEKLKAKELWREGENVYLQCVTYSGHNPFILPDELKRIKLEGEYPDKLRDYITMANYTDHAIGQFVDYLKTRSDYKNTMIVITGDHEGLAGDRASLCSSRAGKRLVSDKQYTPFIIVNSPVAMRYEPVMGQIDMYPTILGLMGLNGYKWHGLGESILDNDKAHVAINHQHQIDGDTTNATPEKMQHLQEAWKVSDLIIRFDYLKSQGK